MQLNINNYFRQYSSLFVRQNSAECEFSGSDSWVVLSPIEKQIKEKIDRIGTPLKDWDISINYGIKTGFNEAFIISGKKRKELIAEDPNSAEIIRPILARTEILSVMSHDFADLWILFIPWHFHPSKRPCYKTVPPKKPNTAFKAQYPAIYKALRQLQYSQLH